MKKDKLIAAMTALAMTGTMTGCIPENNFEQTVYGPPPSFEFEPEENEPVDVYGPPPSDLIEEPDVELEEEFEPEENEIVCVYGPPPADIEQAQESDGE